MSGSALSTRVSEPAAPAAPAHEPQIARSLGERPVETRSVLAAQGAARAAAALGPDRRRPVDLRGRAGAGQHSAGAAALAGGIRDGVTGLDRGALGRARLAAGPGQRIRRALAHAGAEAAERVMTAILEAREAVVRPAPPERRVPPSGGPASTPLFTRHMLGVIEAERDHRRVFRETYPRRRRRADDLPHRRIAAAIAAHARLVGRARVDESRWAAGSNRLPQSDGATTHQEMTRCNS